MRQLQLKSSTIFLGSPFWASPLSMNPKGQIPPFISDFGTDLCSTPKLSPTTTFTNLNMPSLVNWPKVPQRPCKPATLPHTSDLPHTCLLYKPRLPSIPSTSPPRTSSPPPPALLQARLRGWSHLESCPYVELWHFQLLPVSSPQSPFLPDVLLNCSQKGPSLACQS